MADQALLNLSSDSEESTAALARAVAPLLGPGDVILLEGDIGAGKSLFARNVIQARLAEAGLWEDVPSPTFTLVQTYDDGMSEIWHADLYRLTGDGDLGELGLEDAFAHAICLVEWPDRLRDLAPKNALTISLSMRETHGERDLTVYGDPARWARLVAALAEEAGAA